MSDPNELQSEIEDAALASKELAADWTVFRQNLVSALEHALDYLRQYVTQPPYTHPTSKPLTDVWKQRNHLEVVEYLFQDILKEGANHKSARNLSFFVSGGLLSSSIPASLITMTNVYSAKFESSPGAAEIEHRVIRWLTNIFGFDDHSYGCLTSGGSISNLSAIFAARCFLTQRFPASELPVYVTEDTHTSVIRALRVTGFSSHAVRCVPLDANMRMNVQYLKDLLQRDRDAGVQSGLVVATCGTTRSGAIDCVSEISELHSNFDFWLHVDAAYGGLFRLSDASPSQLLALHLVDSIAINLHKGMFLPHGLSAVLLKNGELLRDSHAPQKHELPPVSKTNAIQSSANYSLELTRPFRGFYVWYALVTIGEKAFKAALTEKLLLTKWLYANLRKNQIVQFACEPDLTVLLFKLTNMHSARLVQQLGAHGFHVNLVDYLGIPYCRVAILNHDTHFDTVSEFLRVVEQLCML